MDGEMKGQFQKMVEEFFDHYTRKLTKHIANYYAGLARHKEALLKKVDTDLMKIQESFPQVEVETTDNDFLTLYN